MRRNEDWVVRPEHFVEYLRTVEGLPASEVRVPPRGVLVFARDDFRVLCRRFGARALKWNPRFAIGRVGRARVLAFRTSIGAPAAVLNFEEAIALGVRRVISFGSCGSLVRDLRIGSLVLPTRAYSEEGTSRHYGGGRWAEPDAGLTDALRDACARRGVPIREGGTWTTDAPYREGRAKARLLARRGVVSVEMEASALFRVARVRGVRVASLFVVSDELDGPEWNAGFADPRHAAAMRTAADVAIDTIGRSTG